jgi:hypothetical protein
MKKIFLSTIFAFCVTIGFANNNEVIDNIINANNKLYYLIEKLEVEKQNAFYTELSNVNSKDEFESITLKYFGEGEINDDLKSNLKTLLINTEELLKTNNLGDDLKTYMASKKVELDFGACKNYNQYIECLSNIQSQILETAVARIANYAGAGAGIGTTIGVIFGGPAGAGVGAVVGTAFTTTFAVLTELGEYTKKSDGAKADCFDVHCLGKDVNPTHGPPGGKTMPEKIILIDLK